MTELGAEWVRMQNHFKNAPKLNGHYYFKAASNKA